MDDAKSERDSPIGRDDDDESVAPGRRDVAGGRTVPSPPRGREAGAGGAEQDDSRSRPGRAALFLAIAPLVVLTIVANVGAAFRPTLIANYPVLLLAANPHTLNMTLVSAKVGTAVFFAVVIVRRLIADPCYFMLGRWYGDSAIRWLEKRSPELGSLAATIERWFPRWGKLIVIFYPHPLVIVLAGGSKMRFWTFMFYDFLGTVALAVAVRQFGFRAGGAISPVTNFISKYSVPLTVMSVLLAVYLYWDGRRRGKEGITSVARTERQLERERRDGE